MSRIIWLSVAMVAMLVCDRSSPTPPPQAGHASGPDRVARTVAIDPPAASGSTSPNLIAAGDAILAAWLEPIDSRAHRMRFARFASNQWSHPSTVVERAEIVANWADIPSVAQQSDGTVVALRELPTCCQQHIPQLAA